MLVPFERGMAATARPKFPTHTHFDPTSPVAFDIWRKNHAPVIHEGICDTDGTPMPLIDCTTSPPCGHCWYCKQAVAK